ncbi:MAG: hypothetical protein WD579_01000 [Candidatus Paceibacterota bacterium]
MNKVTKKRVNVTLPERTLKKIDSVAEHGNRSKLIDQAINFYVQEVGRKNLRVRLEEGAQENAERDRRIAEEWFTFDEEA